MPEPASDLHADLDPVALRAEVERLRQALVDQRTRMSTAMARAWQLGEENRALELELAQRRLAEALARGQSQMLIESLSVLTSESNLDRFLGHVLKATVDQLGGVGGTLWFPEDGGATARLHLEYVDGAVIPATESRHPAARLSPRAGGGPLSTFPGDRAETYVLLHEVDGMPEANRRYIMSLGVRMLITVPMVLGSETVGWLCIRSPDAEPPDLSNRIAAAQALAGQATLAMQMATLGEQARQAAVLDERNRIAREIHDTLAQGFTGVLVNLEACTRALKRSQIDAALEHLQHSRALAQAGLAEARASVRTLRPESQPPPDLRTALDTLVTWVQASGAVRCQLVVDGTPRALAREIEIELTRIAQESLTNALKHAQAQHVRMTLTWSPQALRLVVADDGLGFDPAQHTGGLGVVGMHERAARIGAQLELTSRPAAGTRVAVTVRVPAR
ncbi:MAG: sensor histidine kinase [Burkholderiales bacterium]|jgi:signal transduction histidine kinase|nr:sensor histidine kinase [Burkholderiales bacterium]